MISIILAGGYAKRLWPLTKEVAKPLLSVGGKRVIDYIVEKLVKLEDVEKIIVSTNLRFRSEFEKWAREWPEADLEIVCDRSYREEEKPGAVKALSDIVSSLDADCLVIAGDNLFTDDLRNMIAEYRKRKTVVMALYDVKDLNLARNYAVVEVDREMKVISITEKPEKPESTLISTGIYIFPKKTLPRFREYLEGGRNPDEPGRFMEWLLQRETIHGYILSGEWYDVGTPETYKKALASFSKARL